MLNSLADWSNRAQLLCAKNQPETNRFPTLIQESRRLVLRKSTAFQPLYIIAYSWYEGWFCKNRPRSNLRILKHMVGMTVGFTKTNRHPLVVLQKDRNAVGFLSIFCINQPVGIGLVDSWTSPRGLSPLMLNFEHQRSTRWALMFGNEHYVQT